MMAAAAALVVVVVVVNRWLAMHEGRGGLEGGWRAAWQRLACAAEVNCGASYDQLRAAAG